MGELMREYLGTKTPVEIRNKWRTPPYLFGTFHERYGFDKDVAASDDNHLLPDYLTEEMDALDPSTPWGTFNWCNPPYSDISPWVNRAIAEHVIGNSTAMLVPADTSTVWFRNAWETANEVRFISGRIAFLNADTGKPVSNNNKGSVLFVWHAGRTDKVFTMVHRDALKLWEAKHDIAAA